MRTFLIPFISATVLASFAAMASAQQAVIPMIDASLTASQTIVQVCLFLVAAIAVFGG